MRPTPEQAVRVAQVIDGLYDSGFIEQPLTHFFKVRPVEIVYARDPDGRRPYGAVYTDPEIGLVCVLRGTETLTEWLVDLTARLWQLSWLPGTHAHAGFSMLANTLTLGDEPLMPLLGMRGRPILVVGHSLGAALATLVAAQLGGADLLTFGSPRVGDEDFAVAALSRLASCTRYVTDRDIVPKVPIHLEPLYDYQHVGQPTVLTIDAQTPDKPDAWHALSTYTRLIESMFKTCSTP